MENGEFITAKRSEDERFEQRMMKQSVIAIPIMLEEAIRHITHFS